MAMPQEATISQTAARRERQASIYARCQRLASIYDWANLERPLYANARARAIDLLRLTPGANVLDIACGTGASFELIEQRIGRSGRLVGVDLGRAMLERARRRVASRGWGNVRLYQADVSRLSPSEFESIGALAPRELFDGAVCALGLSVIPEWESAWRTMLALVRPGGRVSVMDAGYPQRAGTAGEALAARPLAWLLGRIFAPDGCQREPWNLVRPDTGNSTLEQFPFGYVAVAAGTVRRAGSS